MTVSESKSSGPRWTRASSLGVVAGSMGCVVLSLSVLPWSTSPGRAGSVAGLRVELLRQGDFEEGTAWGGLSGSSRLAAGEGRGGSRALLLEGPAAAVGQTLPLDRSEPTLLRLSGWSRAEGVDGAPDPGYALYADVTYDDGSALLGQAASFSCGTHDWERREIVLAVTRPVKTLVVHCLFRGHAGRAWFDDVSVEEVRPAGGAVLFQGAPLRMNRPGPPAGPLRTTATADGLALGWEGGRIASLRLGGRESSAPAPSGFLVRDVAEGSDLREFREGACDALGLRLESGVTEHPDHLAIRGRLTDATGRDRAVTLAFALPLEARGWRWGKDLRRSERVAEAREYSETVPVPCGATGTLSRYPLAALWSERDGVAMVLDPEPAVHARLAYHAGTRQFVVACDLGLPASQGAEVRFKIYRFDPDWGFRAAVRKMYDVLPDAFASRSQEHGIWMPFLDVRRVREWREFGFKYLEGEGDLSLEPVPDVLRFRYSEPLMWWMPMPAEAPRTEAEALRLRARRVEEGDAGARAAAAAAMKREDGSPALQFRKEPWCHGAVWSLNPGRPPGLEPGTEGVFLDSLEGYAAAELDFDPDRVRRSRSGPSFSFGSPRPVLFKGQIAAEVARAAAEELRPRGGLVFGNGVPARFWFLCPWLDVLGTETEWWSGGTYRPPADETMAFWRTMAFQKPYLLLLNTDFERRSSQEMERYFQRCLLYGFFPSMFSRNASDDPYWENSRWVERDRPLFRKYIPLLRREAIAGWQPVTEAVCEPEAFRVERFGPDAGGTRYFAVLNDSDVRRSGRLTLSGRASGASPLQAQELVSGRTVSEGRDGFPLDLGPHEAWLLEVRSGPDFP